MLWIEEIKRSLDKNKIQLINDSKTPSGEPHVGSLRGVLIHDAVFKALKADGFNVRYTFGSDDYDPVDEIPKGQDEHFEKYLGMPLCNVPPPPGSPYQDMADHFITGFFKTFEKLGVEAETYRMRDIYRSGKFNEPIDKILSNADKIRDIYKKVSGSEKSGKWFPFQSICENCGRIGTTEVISYDGKEVEYICRPNMVKWAKGCGYHGKLSPFDGKGKLPWKLEWVAKWMTFGITIEGAGTDHTTKGGSRDVAVSVLQDIFNLKAPLNIPYGFFLVEGTKMSSSKGIGATAREMSEFLSPEILRYLMLVSPPKRPINFSPTENYIVKLYNEFDLLKTATFSDKPESMMQKELYSVSDLNSNENYYIPSFSLIKTLIQFRHINVYSEAASLKGGELTLLEKIRLESRIKSADYWLDNYAADSDKFQVQESLPSDVYSKLTIEDLGFIKRFENDIKFIEWNEQSLQSQVYNSARLTPLNGKVAFKAVYRIFINNDKGPQVGRLLYYLDRNFVLKRLEEVKLNILDFWKATSLEREDFEKVIIEEKAEIVQSDVHLDFVSYNKGNDENGDYIEGAGVVEFSIKKTDNHYYMKRVRIFTFKGYTDSQRELQYFKIEAKDFIEEVMKKYNLAIQLLPSNNADFNLN